MRVDQGFERWLFIVLEKFPVLAWWWLKPCVVNGGFVQHAFELVGLQVCF
jgi:hypothetical protein